MIPVLKPTADEQTKKELLEVINSGWWGQGPKTKEFEEKFAKKVGVKYAIATNSCTAALDLALKAHDLDYSQKETCKYELITTPMTFVADAIVGEWNGLDVTFADIDEQSLCIDPDSIIVTDRTKVIIAVHSHGRLADIAGIRAKFDGLIIEDCAHALLTPTAGQIGDIAVWSFQAVKTCPAGDGGMITTNDKEIARKVRNLTWLGIEKSTFQRVNKKGYSWDYDIVHGGTKSYMNDISAVLALGNLRRLDTLLERRRFIQNKYNEAFKELEGVTIPEFSNTVQYYTLKVDNRDQVSEKLAEVGIATSVHFKPLSEMSYWKIGVKRPIPVTDRVWKKLLSLPCHDALTNKQLKYIIKSFREIVNEVIL
jgi:perosamine synthetase